MRLLLPLLLAGCSPTRMADRHLEHHLERRGLVEHTAAVGDAEVHYWAGGQGEPILLLHGFGGDGIWTWRPQIDELARTRRVIVPDLLWFGESRGLGGAPSLEAQSRAMLALLDHEGVDRTDVMAVSYGGFVTLQMQVDEPGRFRRVALVDSPGPFFGREDVDALLARYGVATIDELFVPTDEASLQRLIGLTSSAPRKLPKFVLRDVRNTFFATNHEEQRALLADLLAREGDQPPWTPPEAALVVWGEVDPVFPLEVGQQVATWLGAELFVVPDAAHAPNVEEARLFNERVLAFFE